MRRPSGRVPASLHDVRGDDRFPGSGDWTPAPGGDDENALLIRRLRAAERPARPKSPEGACPAEAGIARRRRAEPGGWTRIGAHAAGFFLSGGGAIGGGK